MNAHRLQTDRQDAARHLLARGHDGVVFARVVERDVRTGDLGHALHPVDQLIGLAGHRRDDHGDLVAGFHLAFDVTRHVADAVQIGNRGAAEFHHDARHFQEISRQVLEKRSRLQPGDRLQPRGSLSQIAARLQG